MAWNIFMLSMAKGVNVVFGYGYLSREMHCDIRDTKNAFDELSLKKN